MIIFKKFFKQCSSHPIIIGIFIIAFYISTLIISGTTSLIKSFIDDGNEYNAGFGKDTMLISVNYVNDYNHTNMIEAIEEISENTTARIDIEVTSVSEKKERIVVIGEYFKNNIESKYPLKYGRFYNSEEVKNGEKVVLVGQALEKHAFEKDNKRMIYIDGELYEVIGVVGEEGRKGVWDDNLFMPITSFTKISLESVENLFFSKTYINANNFSEIESDKVMKKLKELDSTIGAQKNKIEVDNIKNIKEAILVNMNYIFIAILIILFATVNLGIISYFWISDRVYEIGVMKAFGITNRQISSILYMEILVIILFSSCLSIITQYIVSNFESGFFQGNINLSMYNTLVILVVNTIVASIITTGSIIRALKIQPIEILKR